ncbi:MAG TPA: CPBP family intramembrane glutamic endopeptidase [Bradyrhizobium sp.]|uniref:CPBP family intramembrane glutamic endopeptidase n=1 Tax=Bradyrhizobium sp. TaxID=376 RepID=UPI002CFF8B8A|nr:CPBP family intramembrane glutamic endopeptidase [Bradyrhizobium sp.]HLZ06752.1 CPBP family intramembrane glutamic endopeptidase [Bradyrhizobium sp.]
MDSLNPEILPIERAPHVWKFWGTALWGFVVFAALFIGQIAVVIFFVLRGAGSANFEQAVRVVASSGLAISLSVIAGLPAVAAALWLAIHWTRIGFADYLALRWTNWRNLVLGVVGLGVLVEGWDLLSRATGHDVTPDFMIDVLKSARGGSSVWLLAIAICVAAPISEELFARGFLYRGWSETALGVPGAIGLSSLAWTSLHLQYDWFFFCEVFCIGLWFGYMRYRSNSLWLTILLHGLNNLGALVQTIWLAG